MGRKRKQLPVYQRFFLILAVLFFMGGMIYFLFVSRDHSFLYHNLGVKRPLNFPVLGIDISHHQGEINYEEVLKMGQGRDSIQFVYIKATEGVDHLDTRYDQNAEGFAAYGVQYGFYHYFHPALSARQQAHFYAETVGFYNFKLRPVLDIEVDEGQSAAQMVDSVLVFLDLIEDRLHTRPIIYTYISFYETLLANSLLDQEDWWFAAYSKDLQVFDHEQMLIWQFTEKGTVDGIGNFVDLNVGKEGVLERLKR